MAKQRLHPETVEALREVQEGRRRWRICDPRRRFRYDVVRRPTVPVQWWFGRNREIERLADRLWSLQGAALAQLKRECGPAWPSAPARKPRALPPSRNTAPVERRAFAFDVTAPGVLEGLLVPYGVPVRIGGAFDETFEPGSLLENNGLLVNVLDDWESPLAWSGKGLELEDGPGGLRAVLTVPDTIDGRRVRAPVEAGGLTAFSATFQALEEEWPAADRRIVRRARLVGLALVDKPEHETPFIDGDRGAR